MNGPNGAIPPGMNMQGISQLGNRQEIIRSQVQQAINQLAIQIYHDLAVEHIRGLNFTRCPDYSDPHTSPPDSNRERLRALAKASQEAALDFFVGNGILKVEEPNPQAIKRTPT